MSVVRHIDYVPSASEREALLMERRLIGEFKPDFNVMWKDDKSYPYVVLSWSEDYPRLFLSRNKKKDGNLYFGPYPNVSAVRSLLRWAWRRKLFPLRPCKLTIVEGQPYPYSKVKSCLYLHTGECPAPCLGKISSKAYRKTAERARLFFEGKKDKLIAIWEKEMNQFALKKNFEQAAEVRDRLVTLRHMDEQVTFRQMSEEFLGVRIQGSRAVQELKVALNLKKPPEIIECFDISHFQGAETVASMVSFKHGRPNKSGYRKFIIKTVAGVDDFKSMEEVVRRRYQRVKSEGSVYPDLILIDGGKGQLGAALKSLETLGLKSLEIASLAKEEEEIFVPGKSDSIRIPMDSPALLLLRQVRDEAHRFAITFHRKRRNLKTIEYE
jgi:excinuclease ABC subunit C